MKVRVKLYARLERYLPRGGDDPNQADLDIAKDTTVAEIFQGLGLPAEYCHLVLVNGHFLPPEERGTRTLKAGDHLAVWPPVAGGAGEQKSTAGGVDKKTVAGGAGEQKSAGGAGPKAAPAARKKTLVSKEMALTHADFFRILPKALGTTAFKKAGRGAVLEEGDRRLEIGLGPERARKIAGLSLPATDVTLAFVGYEKTEISAALKKFERAFQKGGG